jgi:hypothetical protein
MFELAMAGRLKNRRNRYGFPALASRGIRQWGAIAVRFQYMLLVFD